MAHESESEVIRQQMQTQRAALSEKLDTLETRIVDTVEGAREAVAETVETVKIGVQDSVHAVRDSVQTSVHAVQESFDLPRQVDRHPWAMFGGAVAAGFAAGYLLNRMGAPSRTSTAAAGILPEPVSAPPASSNGSSWPQDTALRTPAAPIARRESWLDELTKLFGPELQKVKSLAVGALMGVVREMIADPLPNPMRPQVKDIVDNITTKLGGELVTSEAVEAVMPRRHDDHHNGHCRVEPGTSRFD